MLTAITDILHERRAIDMLKYERNSAKIGEFIHFLKHNVLNISEITRQNKLTEILNKFAGEKTEEVFIVQNSKNKEAQAAVVDVEYLMELIEYKNKFILAQDEEADEFVYKMAIEREGTSATKTLGEVAAMLDLSWENIMKAKDRMEID